MRTWPTIRRTLGVAAALLLAAAAPAARAFPGVIVAKDAAPRAARSTSLVLMRHAGYSIVTILTEVEGPERPFALLLPVPADVTAGRLRTVKRGVLARLESTSAPRLHAFYEQDPCDDAPVEQAWQEHIKAQGRGFLTPEFVPPGDRRYAVSNAISKPVEPSFKEAESEFSYRILELRTPEALGRELARLGYVSPDERTLGALAVSLAHGKKLLVAEVALAHVELGRGDRLRLGGIRYWSREPVEGFADSLGPIPASGREDVFVYVLDRSTRYTVRNLPNVTLPSNVIVEPRAAEQLSSVHESLLDAALVRAPGAVVVEYAWSTSGCGEPCPDVPLGTDELMTLGGDVLEASTTSAAERKPDPGPEPDRDSNRFEQRLAEMKPAERPSAVREHRAERQEIARRTALGARQTYVLTRLHHVRPAGVPARDIELAPAPPLTGGVGIPAGRAGVFTPSSADQRESRLQTRYVALYPWMRGVACPSPRRGAWGKRWASEARQSRAVPLALDLGAARLDRGLLESVLVRPLPELGLREHAPLPATPSLVPSGAPTASAAPAPRRGCAIERSRDGGLPAAFVTLVLGAGVRRRSGRRRLRA